MRKEVFQGAAQVRAEFSSTTFDLGEAVASQEVFEEVVRDVTSRNGVVQRSAEVRQDGLIIRLAKRAERRARRWGVPACSHHYRPARGAEQIAG